MTAADATGAGGGTLRPVDDDPTPDRLSVLGQLARRREEIRVGETITLPVPRWTDPEIKVVFRPVDHKLIRRAQTMADRASEKVKSEAEVNANADVLIAGVESVHAVIDGKRYSLRPGDPEGPPTSFDEDLAENLGCAPNARAVVKALYLFEGDIIGAATKIAEFSGYREQTADEGIAGE